MDSNVYVKKDAITINEKLVIQKLEESNEYVTRIPYTKEYVKFPVESCMWLSEHTMEVHVPDDMQIPHSFDEDFSTSTLESGKELKENYDKVIRKHMEQQQKNVRIGQPNITQENKAPPQDTVRDNVNMPIVEEREITQEDKNRVHQEINSFDDFNMRVYKDESTLKYYPQMMQGDADFNRLLSYRNQQQIFADDYLKRNEMTKAMECQHNIDVADTLIKEKTDSVVNAIQRDYQPDMAALKNHSAVALDVEQFKSFPADLQRDESFKSLVVYKAQLEDLRSQYVNAINTATMNYQNALDKAAPDVLLQYEKSMLQNEKVQVDNVARLTEKINNVNFAINYQVSQIQQINPVEIKPIGEQMSTLGIKTSNQVGRYIHAQENLIKIGNPCGNLSMYQTKDGRNLVGRNMGNGRIEQIGMHGALKDIRKSFKNHMASVKQEMKLQQQQKMKVSFSFGER